jgi:uncharacterized protein (TIGR02452 family)
MNRNKRIEVAEKTLKIIETGKMEAKEGVVDFTKAIAHSIDHSQTISINDWEKLLFRASQIDHKNLYQTDIQTLNCTTIEALRKVEQEAHVCILNFASAKNPGGGFLGGASAQEESLARSSSLYASQIKDMTMYDYNRNQSSFLYSDYMIYSPDVIFWFDDDGNMIDTPPKTTVITSPAPNKGAMLQHNRKDEIAKIEVVFKERIEKFLTLAVLNKIDTLILGAWGCGVFRNEPEDVARYFKEVINSKFKNSFKQIIYAVYDSSQKKQNFLAFQKTMLS